MRYSRIEFPDNQIKVIVQANSSYQIKRIIKMYGNDKGLELMTISGILRNTGQGPRLRELATFKDLKHEKNLQLQKQRQRKNRNVAWKQ